MNSQQPRRVLVTGSRSWTDTALIRTALAAVWLPGTILVTGACPRGADHLAEQCWTHWGGTVELWPADWAAACTTSCPAGHRRSRRDGTCYCPLAGMNRNRDMVAAGADVCLAFIRQGSPGATHCAGLAERAGIHTRIRRS